MDRLDGYFTPTQVAEMFGVCVDSVRGWCRKQKLDCVRIGKYWFIPKAALEHVLEPPRPMNLLTRPYLTITEAAQVLQIGRRTLAGWVRRGKVPTERFGGLHMLTRRTVNELMIELQEEYQE